MFAGDSKTQVYVRDALPILVKQAQNRQTITFLELTEALGLRGAFAPLNIGDVCKHISTTLAEAEQLSSELEYIFNYPKWDTVLDALSLSTERYRMQEQTTFQNELEQKQIKAINTKIDRLIEHRTDIMDEVARADFSSDVLITTSLSDEDIRGLLPQAKECVIEQRTLDATYRQLLLECVDELSALIEKYQALHHRIVTPIPIT